MRSSAISDSGECSGPAIRAPSIFEPQYVPVYTENREICMCRAVEYCIDTPGKIPLCLRVKKKEGEMCQVQ